MRIDRRSIIFVFLSVTMITLQSCMPSNNGSLQNTHYDDINYVDSEVFEQLKTAYDNIGFSCGFQPGNFDLYDYYIEQFNRLLNLEDKFYDKRTDQEYYLNEFSEMDYSGGKQFTLGGQLTDEYNPSNYLYLFFDMCGDGSPELGITNQSRFTYIFKYTPDTDSFTLFYELLPGPMELVGTRAVRTGGQTSPICFAYVGLDEQGNDELIVRTIISSYRMKNGDDGTLYMVTLPDFADDTRNVEMNRALSKQSVPDTIDRTFDNEYPRYFRVTEEQFNELTDRFIKNNTEAMSAVSYTYNELFGLAS